MFTDPSLYLSLREKVVTSTPFAVIFGIACWWLSANYESGSGLHIAGTGALAGWLSLPLVCWFVYQPQNSPLHFLVSWQPGIFKLAAVSGYIFVMAVFTLITLLAYFNAL